EVSRASLLADGPAGGADGSGGGSMWTITSDSDPFELAYNALVGDEEADAQASKEKKKPTCQPHHHRGRPRRSGLRRRARPADLEAAPVEARQGHRGRRARARPEAASGGGHARRG
ncbi:unnamed protein product, partial [Prorocentrum cordatum]